MLIIYNLLEAISLQKVLSGAMVRCFHCRLPVMVFNTQPCHFLQKKYFIKIMCTSNRSGFQTQSVQTESHRFECMANPLVDSNRPPHRFSIGPVQPAGPVFKTMPHCLCQYCYQNRDLGLSSTTQIHSRIPKQAKSQQNRIKVAQNREIRSKSQDFESFCLFFNTDQLLTRFIK